MNNEETKAGTTAQQSTNADSTSVNPQLEQCNVSGSFSYKTISAHNNDLYEPNGWAFKHLIELGKDGWEVVKIQSMHECGSWVFLKNCR